VNTGKLKIQWTRRDENNMRKLLKGRIDIFPVNIDVGFDLLHKYFILSLLRDHLLTLFYPRMMKITNID